jgi:hypothetical protein
VLELVSTRASCVTVVADPRAVDAVMDVEGAFPCRLAPDEVLLVGAPGDAGRLVAAATDHVSLTDDDALVVDATDGWSLWTLEGEQSRAAVSRLSRFPVPDQGFAQGDAARVAAKLIVRPDRVHLLVPAMWRSYLHDRILERCTSLEISEREDATTFTAEGAVR